MEESAQCSAVIILAAGMQAGGLSDSQKAGDFHPSVFGQQQQGFLEIHQKHLSHAVTGGELTISTRLLGASPRSRAATRHQLPERKPSRLGVVARSLHVSLGPAASSSSSSSATNTSWHSDQIVWPAEWRLHTTFWTSLTAPRPIMGHEPVGDAWLD